MFDIGWPEMLVVAIVLIVVVGPKDLPAMLRTFGRTTSKLRAMAGDFRKQFDEALKEAELDDVKGAFDDVRKLNPAADLKKALSPMQKAAEDVRSGLDAAMRPKAKPQAEGDAAKGSISTTSDAKPAAPLKNGQDMSAAPSKSTSAGGKSAAKPKTAFAPKAKSVSAKPAAPKPATAKSGTAKPTAKSMAKPKAAPKRPPAKAAKAGTAAKKGG